MKLTPSIVADDGGGGIEERARWRRVRDCDAVIREFLDLGYDQMVMITGFNYSRCVQIFI